MQRVTKVPPHPTQKLKRSTTTQHPLKMRHLQCIIYHFIGNIQTIKCVLINHGHGTGPQIPRPLLIFPDWGCPSHDPVYFISSSPWTNFYSYLTISVVLKVRISQCVTSLQKLNCIQVRQIHMQKCKWRKKWRRHTKVLARQVLKT